MERIVKTGQIWKDSKGNKYRIDGVFVSEIHEDQETVMYSDDLGICFFRSVENFLAVEGSVTNFYRFERVS